MSSLRRCDSETWYLRERARAVHVNNKKRESNDWQCVHDLGRFSASEAGSFE